MTRKPIEISLNTRAFLLATTMIVAFNAPVATAQDDSSEDDTSIQDTVYVVAPNFVPRAGQSANKSDIALIETPQSVSVITRDQIDRSPGFCSRKCDSLVDTNASVFF